MTVIGRQPVVAAGVAHRGDDERQRDRDEGQDRGEAATADRRCPAPVGRPTAHHCDRCRTVRFGDRGMVVQVTPGVSEVGERRLGQVEQRACEHHQDDEKGSDPSP